MKLEDEIAKSWIAGEYYSCDYLGKFVTVEVGDYIRTKDYGWKEVKRISYDGKKNIHYHIFHALNIFGGIDIYPEDILEFKKGD